MFASAFSTTAGYGHSIHTLLRQQTKELPRSESNSGLSCRTPPLISHTKLFSEPSQKVQEAQELLAKAQKLRDEINASTTSNQTTSLPASDDASITTTTVPTPSADSSTSTTLKASEWSVNYDSSTDLMELQAKTYRLYLDVGREDGTWMDPRWGASGRRIEGTLDVCFTSLQATPEMEERMVSDNQMGSSSACYMVQAASKARLKGGFDQMQVVEWEGAYRVDGGGSKGRASSQTLRFFITAKGKQDGDVSIPEGRLYFSLPCFLTASSSNDDNDNAPPQVMLSNKEGIISVRQIGWHTGWRREESRILGVFRAVPMEKAQRIDGY